MSDDLSSCQCTGLKPLPAVKVGGENPPAPVDRRPEPTPPAPKVAEPDLKVQIEKLSPREGDVLVVRCRKPLLECATWNLNRILEPLKCKVIVLTEGHDAKLLDGEAMGVALYHFDRKARECGEWDAEQYPQMAGMADRYHQTAKTIREWLIPKDEETRDGGTERPAAADAAAKDA